MIATKKETCDFEKKHNEHFNATAISKHYVREMTVAVTQETYAISIYKRIHDELKQALNKQWGWNMEFRRLEQRIVI